MKRCFAVAALILAGAIFFLLPARGQNFNEREITSEASSLDKSNIWALDFRFKDPRLIKVYVPGRGTRICWYMWYQIINRTGEPRRFVPDFELVTLDFPSVFPDEVLPSVQDAIKRLEDPTGYQDIKNSVTIASDSIPVSKADAFPRTITGVAIWDGTSADPQKREAGVKDLSDATRFSVFVRGLSNGYVIVDPLAPGLRPITRYKTLQLNFKRRGERFVLDSRDIEFVAPAQWVYRAARRQADALE